MHGSNIMGTIWRITGMGMEREWAYVQTLEAQSAPFGVVALGNVLILGDERWTHHVALHQ